MIPELQINVSSPTYLEKIRDYYYTAINHSKDFDLPNLTEKDKENLVAHEGEHSACIEILYQASTRIAEEKLEQTPEIEK